MSSGIETPLNSDAVDNDVQSVRRALQLLLAFRAGGPEQSLAGLSTATGLTKSTAHRLLATLEHAGFIERGAAAGSYRLGLALFELGALVQRSLQLRERARPMLATLARATGETASLCIRDGQEALCVERVESTNPVKVLALDVGGRLPLHAGAAPRVLLAYMDDLEVRRLLVDGVLPRFTPATLVDREAILADRALVRAQGYCVSREDVVEDVTAIGAPVRDAAGSVVAAVSVVGISARFTARRETELIAQVRLAADSIAERLGFAGARLIG